MHYLPRNLRREAGEAAWPVMSLLRRDLQPSAFPSDFSVPSPCLRVSVVNDRARAKRRGQTMVFAIAILFLVTLLGSVWVTLLVRNLARTTRHNQTDDALAQALAGLKYAARQFRESEEGADWRPRPSEPLWMEPRIGAEPPQRMQDPDRAYLSDNGTYRKPFVRVPNGRGYFLLRVDYAPSFKPASAASELANRLDEFDRNSGMIHIESIGVAREFDPNDPTFLNDPTETANSGAPKYPTRRVEAWVPAGLVDQLWWITNVTGERGPAQMGVPPFRDGTGRLVQHGSLFTGGGIKSEVSLQWNGRNVVRMYPARGEVVSVAGDLLLSPQANDPGANPQLSIQLMDDDGDPGGTVTVGGQPFPVHPEDDQDDNPNNDRLIAAFNADQESKSALFNTARVFNEGRVAKDVLQDNNRQYNDEVSAARSARKTPAPKLDEKNSTTGVLRWLQLTRDSGGVLEINDNGQPRLINAGLMGLTDQTLQASVRAQGLFLDNWGDIQYYNDRMAVKDEWLQRGAAAASRRGWIGDMYVPSVLEGGTLHPIAEVFFTTQTVGAVTRPVIGVTRYDTDVRQMNLAPDTGRQRLFYNVASLTPTARGGQATVVPVGQTKYFDYPQNGVFYCAGSVRVRGSVGGSGAPKQLHLVSGGTIYIEGSVLKGDPGSALGLSAHDFVTLNPTMVNRIRPGGSTVVEADTFDANGNPSGYHFTVNQGTDIDFTVNSAEPIGDALLHWKHTSVFEDVTSNTEFTLFPPSGTRYDFGSNPPNSWPALPLPAPNRNPPVPPAPYPNNPYSGAAALFYLFRPLDTSEQRDPTTGDPLNWHESMFQTQAGSPANYERKSFFLPGIANLPGDDAAFRILVGETMRPNSQPYWLSKAAVIPLNRPLPVRIQAVIYAYTGSWFVIPPPFFNDNDKLDPITSNVWDSRANFAATGLRAPGTFPRNTADFPFYHEPLNLDIEVIGSISENMPAAPEEQALWTQRLWTDLSGWDPTAFPIPARPAFSPRITYRYDGDLRRLVRVRYSRTGQELVAWALPARPTLPTPPAGVPYLDAAIAAGIGQNSYVEVLPLIPRMPSSSVVYEGTPL